MVSLVLIGRDDECDESVSGVPRLSAVEYVKGRQDVTVTRYAEAGSPADIKLSRPDLPFLDRLRSHRTVAKDRYDALSDERYGPGQIHGILLALPNGSRLSCGRNARGRKAAQRQKQSWPARQRNSSLLASARQLQALVRQRNHGTKVTVSTS